MTKSGPFQPRILLCASLALALAVPGLAIAAGHATRAPGEPTVGGRTPDDMAFRMEELSAWLVREIPAGALADPLRIELTPQERQRLASPESTKLTPPRIGVVKAVERDISLGTGRSGTGGGTFQGTDDGGFVWAVAVRSEGAKAIRVRITGMDLPANADLYFSNLRGEAHGPYQGKGRNGDGDFWTHSVAGDEGILVLRHFGPMLDQDLTDLRFRIVAVGHIQERFGSALETLCNYNENCVESASGNHGAADPDAIAYMEWIQGAWIYSCTGGLLADTDSGTQIPYFLTANHCLNKTTSNLELFWQYTSGCSGPSNSNRTMGATLRVTGRKGDFSLFELDEPPLAGSSFMGWNNTPIAHANGAVLHRISHPSGAPQAYSRHTVDDTFGSCQGWPIGERIYSHDEFGATEGGSSGSPVVNSSGEVVGQLSGGCGFDVGNVCNSDDNRTVDGALAFYWASVAPFLDPGTTCNPSPEVCDDAVDNDCDNATDCSDADCTGNPACGGGGCVNPGGAPQGASCDGDGDCCSNKCKGPPSNKTCR